MIKESGKKLQDSQILEEIASEIGIFMYELSVGAYDLKDIDRYTNDIDIPTTNNLKRILLVLDKNRDQYFDTSQPVMAYDHNVCTLLIKSLATKHKIEI